MTTPGTLDPSVSRVGHHLSFGTSGLTGSFTTYGDTGESLPSPPRVRPRGQSTSPVVRATLLPTVGTPRVKGVVTPFPLETRETTRVAARPLTTETSVSGK